jgi:surfactin synthase thioesterase subunit
LLWHYGSAEPSRTFVLAPYAGGSAFAFAEWIPRLVAPDEAAVVLRYPVREPGDTEHSLAALADDAAGAVLAAADSPLVLVGHSMGGLVAYELAQRLEPFRPVHLLVVSASRPPGHARMSVAQVLGMTGGQWRDEVLAQGLVDEELAAAPGMLDLVVPTLRANYLLLARHPPPTGRLSCPLLVIGGVADAEAPPELLNLWVGRTSADCTTKLYSGGHFYYRNQLPDVCRKILDTARSSGVGKLRNRIDST